MKTPAYIPLITFILALIPAGLLFVNIADPFGIELNGFVAYISSLPILYKLIFYNTVFFLIPSLAIIGGIIGIKNKSFIFSVLSIILSTLVLMWYAVHLMLD